MHEVRRLDRRGPGDWAILCTCHATVEGPGPIEVHRAHQEHVAAEYLAEEYGVERVAS
ncbi:MAG: hypothetical protein ABSF84_02730 [Acidimicrobiales bacterium]|jgi:hypothetical protein